MQVCAQCLVENFVNSHVGLKKTRLTCALCEVTRIDCCELPAAELMPTPAAVARMGKEPEQWLQRIIEAAALEEDQPMLEAIENLTSRMTDEAKPNSAGHVPGKFSKEELEAAAERLRQEKLVPESFKLAQDKPVEDCTTAVEKAEETYEDAPECDDVLDELKKLVKNEMRKDEPTFYLARQRFTDGTISEWTAYVAQRSGLKQLTLIDDVDMVDRSDGRMYWVVRLYNPLSKPELEVAAMIATKAGVERERISDIKVVIL